MGVVRGFRGFKDVVSSPNTLCTGIVGSIVSLVILLIIYRLCSCVHAHILGSWPLEIVRISDYLQI
jgi:hypothetical protein